MPLLIRSDKENPQQAIKLWFGGAGKPSQTLRPAELASLVGGGGVRERGSWCPWEQVVWEFEVGMGSRLAAEWWSLGGAPFPSLSARWERLDPPPERSLTALVSQLTCVCVAERGREEERELENEERTEIDHYFSRL